MEKLVKIVFFGAVALTLAQNAAKADFAVTHQRDAFGGWGSTYRELGPPDNGIRDMAWGPAPANDCNKRGIKGFQLVNPRPGEAECFGGR